MHLHPAFFCALVAFHLLTPPSSCAVPKPHAIFENQGDKTVIWKSQSPDTGDCLGIVKKDQKLLIVRHGEHQADFQVYSSGKLLYTMPDITVDFQDECTEPGEADPRNPYDFFVSPDHCYLFVTRGIDRSRTVGYLYKRSAAGQMVPVQPGGRRLDEAALHYYCRHFKEDESFLGRGERDIGFVRWNLDQHQIVFTMEAASYETRPSRFPSASSKAHFLSAYWYTAYNLKTGHFNIIRHLIVRRLPDKHGEASCFAWGGFVLRRPQLCFPFRSGVAASTSATPIWTPASWTYSAQGRAGERRRMRGTGSRGRWKRSAFETGSWNKARSWNKANWGGRHDLRVLPVQRAAAARHDCLPKMWGSF